MKKLLGNSHNYTTLAVTPWFVLYGDNYYSPLNFEKIRETLSQTENNFNHDHTDAEHFTACNYNYGHYDHYSDVGCRMTTHPIINDKCQHNVLNLYWIDSLRNENISDGDSIYDYDDEVLGTEDITDVTWNNIRKFQTFIHLWRGRLILTTNAFATYHDLGTHGIATQILDFDEEFSTITLFNSVGNIIDVNLNFDDVGKYVNYSIINRSYKYVINGIQLKQYFSDNNFTFGTQGDDLINIYHSEFNTGNNCQPMITKAPASDGSANEDYYFNFMLPNIYMTTFDSGTSGPGIGKHVLFNYRFKITYDGIITKTRGADISVELHVPTANDRNYDQCQSGLRQIDLNRTEFTFHAKNYYPIHGIGIIHNINAVDIMLPDFKYFEARYDRYPTLHLFPQEKRYDLATGWAYEGNNIGYLVTLNPDSSYNMSGDLMTYNPLQFIDHQSRRWERTTTNRLYVHSSSEGRVVVSPKYPELLFSSDDTALSVPITQRGTMNIITVEQTGTYTEEHRTMKVSLKLSDDESYFVTDTHVLEPVISGSAVKVFNLEIEYGTSIDIAIMLMNANPFDIDVSQIGPNDAYPDPEEIELDIYSGKLYSPEMVNMTYIILDSNLNQQTLVPYVDDTNIRGFHKVLSFLPDDNSSTNIVDMPGVFTNDILDDEGQVISTNITVHKTDDDGVFYYKNPDDIILVNVFGIFIHCTVKNLIHLSDFKPFVGLYDVRMLNALRIFTKFNGYADENITNSHLYLNAFTDQLVLESIDDLANKGRIDALVQQSSPILSESMLVNPYDMYTILKRLLNEKSFNIDTSKPIITINSSIADLTEGEILTITVNTNITFPDYVKVKLNALAANYVPDGDTSTDITYDAGELSFDANKSCTFSINILDNEYNNMNELLASTITVYDSANTIDDFGIAFYYGTSKTYNHQSISRATRIELLVEAQIDQEFILDNLSVGFIADFTNIYTYGIFNSELHDNLDNVLINYLDDNTETFARISTIDADVTEGEEASLVITLDQYPAQNARAYVTIRYTNALLGHQVFGVETFSMPAGSLTFNFYFKILIDNVLDNDYTFNVELVSVWVGDYELSLTNDLAHNAGKVITYNVTSKEVTEEDDLERYGTFFSIYPCNNLQWSYSAELDADLGGANNYRTAQEEERNLSGIYKFEQNEPVLFRIGNMVLGDIPVLESKHCKSYMSAMDLFVNEIDRSINSVKVTNINRVLMGLNTNNFHEILSINVPASAHSFNHDMIDWSDETSVNEVAGMLGITLADRAQTYLSFRTMMIAIYGEHNLDPLITVSTNFVRLEEDGTPTSVNEFNVGTPIHLLCTVNAMPTAEIRVLVTFTSPTLTEDEHYITSSHQVIIPAGEQSSNTIQIDAIVPGDFSNSMSYFGTLNCTVNAVLDNPSELIPGGFPYINTTNESTTRIKDYVNILL